MHPASWTPRGGRSPGAGDLELADRLRERKGLKHGRPAGRDHRPHDVLGRGWARTVLEMAAHLRKVNFDEVVQLTGALTERDRTRPRRGSTRRRACLGLLHPPIVSDPETALRHPADCRTADLDLLDAHLAVGRVGRAVGPEHPTSRPARVNGMPHDRLGTTRHPSPLCAKG
jgi:hypothetical protein